MLEDVHHKAYIRKNHERLQKSIALLLQMEKELLRLTQLATMYQFAKQTYTTPRADGI